MKRIAFVAYTTRDKAVGEAVLSGVEKANAIHRAIRFEPWEYNDIAGSPILSPILTKIEDSEFVVADITLLNLNVVYEIGYAIAKHKRVFLVRHKGVAGDSALAKSAGIFDTVGYQEYENSTDLSHRLTSEINKDPLSVNESIDRKAPVYIVEPSAKGDAETMMISRLKKARHRFRSFSPSENSRMSAVDAIQQVGASSGVLVCMQSDQMPESRENNVRALFVAGLAHGLGKPTLIVAPRGMTVPLDVLDSARTYQFPEDIVDFVAELSLEITEYQQQADPPRLKIRSKLQSLVIGDPTAENESTTLASYYLAIDQYNRALQGEVNLVLGRKGSGKTALFIQLRDKVRSDRRNIVIDLKPEGYQLVKLKEDVLNLLSDGSRQHLVTAFWEFLLLLEVAYKLLEKDKKTYKNNHTITNLYEELDSVYRNSRVDQEGDFSERLMALSRKISGEYQARHGGESAVKLSTTEVTNILFSLHLPELKNRLSRYLEHKQSVWVLFDNLDKGWSTHGIDETDALILRCLINAGRAIERDMQKQQRKFRCVVFVRNDVYEHLLSNSPDYGKEMPARLDWTDRDLLREMLRLRLASGLEGDADGVALEQLLPIICVSHYKGHEIVDYMIERSLMRPRNLLKIFLHARGFASNLGHGRIESEDLEKGLKAYSEDLLLELDRELSDVLPGSKDVMYNFLDCNSRLGNAELMALVSDGNDPSSARRVADFLIYYGVLGLALPNGDQYIYDVGYDSKKLSHRINKFGESALYCINPAFWPALNIAE